MASRQDTDSMPSALPAIRAVPPETVLRWIRLGWRDLRQSGWPSLLHGLLIMLAGLLVIEITKRFWPLLPGAISGFLVVAPILATGLFALSQTLEHGHRPHLRDAVHAWRTGSHCLFRLGVLLVLVTVLWMLLTKAVFHFVVDADIQQPTDFIRYVVSQPETLFLQWTVLAGLVCALIFSLLVVSVPLLVDRDVDAKRAMATSLRAVGANPVTMVVWACCLLLATALSLATFLLGFVLIYPLLGHASWHAYRDLVDASDLPSRPLGR
jgi:uncharacterized membrane protein